MIVDAFLFVCLFEKKIAIVFIELQHNCYLPIKLQCSKQVADRKIRWYPITGLNKFVCLFLWLIGFSCREISWALHVCIRWCVMHATPIYTCIWMCTTEFGHHRPPFVNKKIEIPIKFPKLWWHFALGRKLVNQQHVDGLPFFFFFQL